jgi:hypothetical protein
VSDPDLPDEVRRSLRAQADRIEVVDVPFDPDAPRSLDLDERGTARPPRSRGWGVAAAAAAVVLALAAGIAIGERDPDQDEATTAEGVETPPSDPVPDGAADADPGWLPEVPEGLAVWALDWGTTTVEQPPLAQLFESRTSAARLLVVVRADGRPVEQPDLEVRGRAARAGTSPTDPTVATYTWVEGGAELTAMTRDMGRADALAFLAGLTWRTSAPAGGFANPTGAILDLAAEAEGGLVEVRTTTVVLADDPSSVGGDDGRTVRVEVGAPVDPDRPTVDTVRDRFAGEVDADGTITHDDPSGTYRRTEPDGTWVQVETDDRRDDGADIADTVAEAEPEELFALRAEIEQRVADEIPIDAAIAVADRDGAPGATVELRTSGSASAVCLVLDRRPRRCSGVEATVAGVAGSFLVDDEWWVAVVDRSDVTITEPDGDAVRGVREGDEGVLTAAVGSPPERVDVVRAGSEGDEREVRRPPA